MPDADLSVRFGSDLAGFNAGIAQVKVNLASFSPAAVGQARASLDQLNDTLRNARAASNTASSGWRETLSTLADLTTVVRGGHDAIDYFVSALDDAFDGAANSVSRYFTYATYAERSTRLYEQANEGLQGDRVPALLTRPQGSTLSRPQ